MSYKVIYFGVNGRGEATRMALAHAKADWTDDRLGFEQFGPRKAAGEFPNGQLPVLVYNGKYLNESLAILRFVGKQFGYYPADHLEAWYVDSLTDYVNDFIGKLYPIQMPIMNKKEFNKEESIATYKGHVSTLSAYLEKQLKEHGKPFIAGEKISIADFTIAALAYSHIWNDALPGGADFTTVGQQVVAEHALLAAYFDRLRNELKTHLETRPAAGI